MTQATPPVQPGAPAGGATIPHRGVMILVFGILSIVICFIFGIAAWVMANRDLPLMAAGQMDASGEGITRAGKVCGIVGVALAALSVCITLVVWLGIAAAAVGAGAAGAGSGGP